MAVYRVERTRDYTVMSNHHLKNRRLSLKARGLLSLMLSLPEDWDYSTRGLASICKEGVDSIGGALKELETEGYIVRTQLRDKSGRITDTEYVIYEQPQLQPNTGNPDMENPDTGNPDMVNPDTDKPNTVKPCTDNPPQENTKEENTKKASKDLSIHPPTNEIDGMDGWELCAEQVRKNISYDALCFDFGAARVDEIVMVITDALCIPTPKIRIGKTEYPAAVVRSRLLRLNQFHIQYVFDYLDKTSTEILDIRSYLLKALFNAPSTMNHAYQQQYNHDQKYDYEQGGNV